MSVQLEDKVEDHEKRITSLEINGGRLDERIIELARATENLKKTTWGFSLLMLLTIIYLLLGRQGYKDVTGTLIPTQHTVENTAEEMQNVQIHNQNIPA